MGPVGPGIGWRGLRRVSRGARKGGAAGAAAGPARPPGTGAPKPDGAREALSSRSETVESVVDTLDAVALSFGEFRVSLFDVLMVSSVIIGVLVFAWFVSRMARRLVRRMTRLDNAQQLLVEKVATIIVWAIAFFLAITPLCVQQNKAQPAQL